MKGIIEKVFEKGYGFIKGADGRSYFFNYPQIEGHWTDFFKRVQTFDTGIPCEFEPFSHEKGPRAYNVDVLWEDDL